MTPRVLSVRALEPYRLRLRFDDGAEGEYDVAKHVKFDGVFAPIRDPKFFARVKLRRSLGTISWPNDADLDPQVLWSEVTGKPLRMAGRVVYRPLPKARRKLTE